MARKKKRGHRHKSRFWKYGIRWCPECDVPLLWSRCDRCGSAAATISVTPPGDVRPGFPFDRSLIINTVDRQFGEGCGDLFLREKAVFLLNRVPAVDRDEEIIQDGVVLGELVFDISHDGGKGCGGRGCWKIVLRKEGARRILEKAVRGVVVCDRGAVPSIMSGSNLMAPGVVEAKNVAEGDEVIVVDEAGNLVGGGTARIRGVEMVGGRGMAVKVRWHTENSGDTTAPGVGGIRLRDTSWETVVEANRAALGNLEERGVGLLRSVLEEKNLPVIASLSGGKDSLAALLVALEAGLRPRVMFLDTGLELPETVENVREVVEKYGLEMDVVNAGDAFWRGLGVFGPPAKDYRWCCKACKLGPTTMYIKERFPGGVVSIIGQRGFESDTRAEKGGVWENPWVPGQVGVSPIQNWSALAVWLYIFSKKAPYNWWYEHGLSRVGCFLCPSADMGDSVLIKERFRDGWSRWERYLREYAKRRGLPEEWVSMGLWRWKKKPGWVREKSFSSVFPDEERVDALFGFPRGVGIWFEEKKRAGDSVELLFSYPVRLENFLSFAPIIGVVVGEKRGREKAGGGNGGEKRGVSQWEVRLRTRTGFDVYVWSDGVVVKNISGSGGDLEQGGDLERETGDVIGVIEQASNCIGCGVCIGRCSSGAIKIVEKRAWVDPERCVGCRECLRGPCPARDFNPERG